MIQLSATMRILVAIEPVDLRKYAPSIDMRSFLQLGARPAFLMRRKPPCWDVGLSIT